MTGPTGAGDKSTRPRYWVTLLRWGTDSPVSMDCSRRTFPAHICSHHTAVPWMFEAAIVLELHRANHVHHSPAPPQRLNLALSELSSYCSAIVKSSGFCEIGPMPACFSEQGGSRRRGGSSVPQTNGEIQNDCQEIRTENTQA